MNGLPENVDLSFLNKKILEQICIGPHNLILRFEENVVINIQSVIELSKQAGKRQKYEDFGSAASPLAVLLNQSVSKAVGRSDGTLSLSFSEDYNLDIYDNSNQYESYQIWNGNDVIVV